MSKVSVIQGNQRRKNVYESLYGLGMEFVDRMKSQKSILIVPNISSTDAAFSTHADTLRGTIDAIRVHSRVPIALGAAGMYGTKAAFQRFGYDKLLREYDALRLVDFYDDTLIEYFIDDGAMMVRRPTFAMNTDFVISMTPMKAVRSSNIAFTIENWILNSWIVPSRSSSTGLHWNHEPWLEEKRDRVLAELYCQKPCDLAIIDGIDAQNTILTGFDSVAVDTVGAALMGIDITSDSHLSFIADRGFGECALSRIDVPLGIITR